MSLLNCNASLPMTVTHHLGHIDLNSVHASNLLLNTSVWWEMKTSDVVCLCPVAGQQS